jgi:ATP-dependent DNA helicase RecQ
LIGEGGSMGNEASAEEVGLIVRKALSAIARIHGRYGLTAAVALLRGVDDPRLRAAGLERTRTFGILAEHGETWLTRLLRRCVTAGWVDFDGGDRPVAILTERGARVMRGEQEAQLLLPPSRSGATAVTTPASRGFVVRRKGDGGADAMADAPVDANTQARFEALRAHRLEVAQAEGVPPYVIASDRSLREIAHLFPAPPISRHELTRAHGIGEAKAQRYGDGFLRVLEALSANLGDEPEPNEILGANEF